jgi:ABC-type transport system involved in cytochrome bd biosynthesis fused ATPase/permease subunit
MIPYFEADGQYCTEATSSLDAVNEAEVEKALQNASKGR